MFACEWSGALVGSVTVCLCASRVVVGSAKLCLYVSEVKRYLGM